LWMLRYMLFAVPEVRLLMKREKWCCHVFRKKGESITKHEKILHWKLSHKKIPSIFSKKW
jgi:hypothetical protein